MRNRCYLQIQVDPEFKKEVQEAAKQRCYVGMAEYVRDLIRKDMNTIQKNTSRLNK